MRSIAPILRLRGEIIRSIPLIIEKSTEIIRFSGRDLRFIRRIKHSTREIIA